MPILIYSFADVHSSRKAGDANWHVREKRSDAELVRESDLYNSITRSRPFQFDISTPYIIKIVFCLFRCT